jgi:hypothetical protein
MQAPADFLDAQLTAARLALVSFLANAQIQALECLSTLAGGRARVDQLSRLPDHLLAREVCKYLTIAELSSCMRASRKMFAKLDPLQPRLGSASLAWAPHWQAWARMTNRAQASHLNMLRGLLAHTENEYGNLVACAPLITALRLLPTDSCVGLVGSIGRFPTEAIARAVGDRRRSALTSVIIRRTATALEFRQLRTHLSGAVSFLALNQALVTCAAARPPLQAPGFLGYAVDLLELQPQDEELRETVLATYVYRDMTVWDTAQHVENAIRAGIYTSSMPFYALLMPAPMPLDLSDGPVGPAASPISPSAPLLHRPRFLNRRGDTDPNAFAQSLQVKCQALRAAVEACKENLL